MMRLPNPGSGVKFCSADGFQRVNIFCHPKVDDLDDEGFSGLDEDVFRLDVSMR